MDCWLWFFFLHKFNLFFKLTNFIFLLLYLDSSLLLPNLRKSKRIRTAFSPTQLLQLEHAFEKNHYVVGQERKELALKLGLSETQVKCHCLSLTLNSDTQWSVPGLILYHIYLYYEIVDLKIMMNMSNESSILFHFSMH